MSPAAPRASGEAETKAREAFDRNVAEIEGLHMRLDELEAEERRVDREGEEERGEEGVKQLVLKENVVPLIAATTIGTSQ